MQKFEKIREAFEANRNSEKARQMASYMRNQFAFYGIQTELRQMLYADLLREEKRADVIDWALLDTCFSDDHREFQYFVMDYLKAKQKQLVFDDINRIKRYVTEKQWWDTIDGLDRIIGNIAFVDSRVNDLMLTWSQDENFWLRRIAIDHQICRREKTDTDLLATVICNNFGSNEFFINKAIGWSLRAYSKTNPEWVRHFLADHQLEMSRLSLREASKYI